MLLMGIIDEEGFIRSGIWEESAKKSEIWEETLEKLGIWEETHLESQKRPLKILNPKKSAIWEETKKIWNFGYGYPYKTPIIDYL